MIIPMIMVGLFSMSAATWVAVGFDEPEQMLGYEANVIIVKFKKLISDSLREQLAVGVPIETLTLSPSLDNLSYKYKVENIEAILKNFYENRKRIEHLLEKDEALLTKRERQLVRRLRRVSTGVKVPDLGRIYRIEFEWDQPASGYRLFDKHCCGQ